MVPIRFSVILLVLLVCIGSIDGRVTPKGVKVSLQAKWPATPLLHEAAEFLADESPALFWSFARNWDQVVPTIDNATDATACWKALTSSASASLTPRMTQVLRMSLAVRSYSPRLETFRQLSLQATEGQHQHQDSCCWVSIGGKIVIEPAQIPDALRFAAAAAGKNSGKGLAAGALLFPFDHVHPSAALGGVTANITNPDIIPAVLYAPMGHSCVASFDKALRAASDADGSVVYAWRPLQHPSCAAATSASPPRCESLGSDSALSLPGYGVELAIKNMEYNASDDSKDGKESDGAGTDAAAASSEDGPDEVAGFKFGTLLKRRPALKQELLTFRDHLMAATSEEQTLKVWDLKDLGMQAVQRITSASDPLHLLRELSQNFPMLVESLSRASVNPEIRAAVAQLQRMLMPGAHFVMINGLMFPVTDFNLHDLVDTVRREVRLMDALAEAGLPPAAAREAAFLRGAGAGQGAVRLDLRPSEAESQIAWANDMETDPEYSRMPRQLMSLLQPSFTGQPPTVRRNIFNAIYLFNPASVQALELGSSLESIIGQGWPIRVGLMPVTNGPLEGPVTSPGDKAARLFALVTEVHGGRAGVDLWAAVGDELSSFDEASLSDNDKAAAEIWKASQKLFKTIWPGMHSEVNGRGATVAAAAMLGVDAALESIVSGTGAGADAALALLRGCTHTAELSGIAETAISSGLLVFNGLVIEIEDGGSWRSATGGAWQDDVAVIQQDVYLGRLIDESDDLYADILSSKGAVPRYNPRALPTGSRAHGLSLTIDDGNEAPARQVPLIGAEMHLKDLASLPVIYFGPSKPIKDADQQSDSVQEEGPAGGVAVVTHWVVGDAASSTGLDLMASALQHESSVSRVGLLVNVRDLQSLTPCEELVVAAAAGLLPSGSPADLVDLLTSLSEEKDVASATYEHLAKLLPEGLNPKEGNLQAHLASLKEGISAAVARHHALVRQLGLGPGMNAVVSNGRILESRFQGDIVAEDFALLDAYAARSQHAGAKLLKLFSDAGIDNTKYARAAADAAAVVSSVLTTYQPTQEIDYQTSSLQELLNEQHKSLLTVHSSAVQPSQGDTSSPLLIQAVLNPLTKSAQQLSGALDFLRQAIGPDVSVLLNPSREYSDLPLKHFYRYVTPDVSQAGVSPPPPPVAAFMSLPPHKTLTLGMDVPEAWLVEPVVAAHDLDNLRLEELPAAMRFAEATFELEALLVTGMCVDAAAAEAGRHKDVHPRGVQLQLGSVSDPARVDTLVMSNLGYYQLKAAPGVWSLRLAPGRSQELYAVDASSGASEGKEQGSRTLQPASGAGAVPVAVTSFSGKDMLLLLRKNADRLEEDVLDAEPATKAARGGGGGGSVWGKLVEKVAGAPSTQVPSTTTENDDETIHVFTVASGHMYERLQKIMILSAIKRTKSRVKFWFIKNYMSPQMKDFVPIMARQYGFDYEFVTYKWPSWLHKQTEKQRIIWAYKILFLDVLFPLNLRKVIFCDSDQVIRADLAELWNHDLGGAPYAYTPFCDTNTDMDGFRFWKQGFWSDHLKGKPYHISALYVVDLERFRQSAAGDQLRVIYDNLSKDPNSLANLDQDLPNYAQDLVPIASLPQEWLWCETWCGEASRPAAKTIDLCNNPLTKEPKLHSARRIIAEWPDLNREAEEFTARVDAVLDGAMSEDELTADKARFMTFLEPMVEGSVRTTEAAAASDGGSQDDGVAEGAVHDGSEL